MSLDTARADVADAGSSGAVPRPVGRRRSRHGRAVASCAAVGLVLAIAVVSSGRGLVTSDEGALLAQARLLEETGAWAVPNPAPELDPDARWAAIEKADVTASGIVPSSKHPLLTWIARIGLRLGGGSPAGVRGLQVLAAVGVVLLTGRLARLCGVARPGLVTLAAAACSPLAYDSIVLMGHPFGTLAATSTVVAAVELDRPRRPARHVAWLAVGFGSSALGPLVRNEAVLVSMGVIVTLVSVSFLERAAATASERLRRWVGAGVVAAGTATGYLADAAWSGRVLGAGARPFHIADDHGVIGRMSGAMSSLLLPGDGSAVISVIAGLGFVAAIGAALRWRRGASPVVPLAVVGVVGAVWPFVAEPHLVGGLFVACPLLAGGLVLARRPASRELRVVAIAASIAVAGVLATQYADGGGLQWGGRYLHVALPAAIVLAAVGVGAAAPAPASRLRLVAALVAVATIGNIAAMSVSLSGVRSLNTASVDSVWEFVERRGDVSGGEAVVATDVTPLGRMSWERVRSLRLLRVSDAADWSELGERLAPGTRLVVATDRSLDSVLADLGVPVEVIATEVNSVGTLRLAELERRGGRADAPGSSR